MLVSTSVMDPGRLGRPELSVSVTSPLIRVPRAKTFLFPKLTDSASVAEKNWPSLDSFKSSLSTRRTLISVPGMMDCAKPFVVGKDRKDRRVPSAENNRKDVLFMLTPPRSGITGRDSSSASLRKRIRVRIQIYRCAVI